MSNKKDTKLYCLCLKPYDGEAFMLGCELCNNWFHGKCMNISKKDTPQGRWHCDRCKALVSVHSELKQDIGSLSKQVEVMAQNFSSYQVTNRDLRDEVAGKDKVIADLKSRNDAEKFDEARKAFDLCVLEIKKELEERDRLSVSFQSTVQELCKIAQKDKVVADLKNELEERNQNIQRLSADNGSLQLTIQEMLHKIAQKDKVVADLKNELEERNQNIQRLSADNGSLQLTIQEMRHKIAQKDKVIADQKNELEERNQNILRLRADSVSLQSTIQELRDKIAQRDKVIENLNKTQVKRSRLSLKK